MRLYNHITVLGKLVTCIYYPGHAHTSLVCASAFAIQASSLLYTRLNLNLLRDVRRYTWSWGIHNDMTFHTRQELHIIFSPCSVPAILVSEHYLQIQYTCFYYNTTRQDRYSHRGDKRNGSQGRQRGRGHNYYFFRSPAGLGLTLSDERRSLQPSVVNRPHCGIAPMPELLNPTLHT